LVGKFEHHDLVALKSPFQDLRAFIGDKDLALELAEYFEEACLIAVVELAPGEFELGDDVDAYGLNDLSALSCGGSLRAESQMRRILNVTRRSRGKTLVGQKAFQNSHLPQSDLPDGQSRRNPVKRLRKNISLYQKGKSVAWSARPVPSRGALRDRHECWARDAMDAIMSSDVRYDCGRRRRVVLAPLGWC
jgi:hypothetical protein